MTSAARRLTASLLTLGLLILPMAWSPATAEEPVDVTGQLTDEAGTLSDADRERVQEALDTFYDDTQRQLFVVYVDSFDGTSGADWAEATATESGLGSADVLVAVATQQRSYGFSVPDDISDADLERVDREYVLPALRRSAWADAAVAAAEGFTEVEQGVDVAWWLVAVGGAAVIGVGGYAVLRTRRRYDHTHHVRDEHGNPVDPADILTDAELEQNASAALVAIDDALRTSEQELGFAEAQFGSEAVQPFRTTLEDGRGHIREAFTLRQQLDDAEPQTDAERRQLASRIITVCEEVDAALDAHVEDFDRMRDIEGNASQALDDVAERIAAVHADLSTTRETWQRLQSTHAESALAPVVGNVADADTLLSAAHEAVGNGRADLAGDVSAAAVHIRAAESATAQADALLTAVITLETALRADRTAADDLAGRVTAQAGAVSTFVETHRAAVASPARTRLSEADRLLQRAREGLASDPEASRTDLERAETLLDEAQQSADADVARWRAEQDVAERPDGAGLDSLLLGGILIDRQRRSSSYGSGSRRRPSAGRRTVSSFGGTSRSTRRSSTSTPRRRSSGGRF